MEYMFLVFNTLDRNGNVDENVAFAPEIV